MAVTESTRTDLPAAGTWRIDQSHTSVGFSVRHLGVARTRGRFGAVGGVVHVADRPEDSSVDVWIDAASVDTRDEARDAHLRSGDFFAVEEHPTWTYRSTGVRADGDRWIVDGQLSVRGVTRSVPLEVTFEGVAGDPWGGTRAAFSATAELNREDFGLTWNQVLEAGGLLVGKMVKVELEVELVREEEPAS